MISIELPEFGDSQAVSRKKVKRKITVAEMKRWFDSREE
jgi:hypothetical protein